MTEKELIKKLSALQSVSADPAWVQKNRDVLSYQIFNGAEYAETKLTVFERFTLISKRVLQPTPIAALIALFFMISGVFGLRASRNATPGEPLYIAKTISERAQLVATFDETAKVRLNLEFASQRATEIEKVLNESDASAKIEALSANFKQELAAARDRLAKIESEKAKQTAASLATKQKLTTKQTQNSNETVTSAQATKDTNGIDISTSTAKALWEAEKLFNAKDYSGAATTLDELGKQLH